VEADLRVKPIWLMADAKDGETETAHYFFLRHKPLATLQVRGQHISTRTPADTSSNTRVSAKPVRSPPQYLEKALARAAEGEERAGVRLQLVAGFANYATLSARPGSV
jgi:hypothetical protein